MSVKNINETYSHRTLTQNNTPIDKSEKTASIKVRLKAHPRSFYLQTLSYKYYSNNQKQFYHAFSILGFNTISPFSS